MKTTQTQTTTVKGKRVRLVTTTKAGKTTVTMKAAPIEEWVLQAAAVRAIKAMPEYAGDATKVAANDNAARQSFTIAGDMNGDFRSKRAAVKATATGIAAGDPDLRIYLPNGELRLIEYKNGEGTLTASQKKRHPLLAALGHPVVTIKVKTEAEAVEQSVAVVKGWLADMRKAA